MGDYFAMRLKNGKLNYNVVIQKYPQFKEDIDIILAKDGYEVLADGKVVKSIT